MDTEIHSSTGYLPEGLTERREREMKLVANFRGKDLPLIPPPVEFKAKFNLPKLKDYRGSFPQTYWAKWRKRNIEEILPNKSWVSPTSLQNLAERAGYHDLSRLNRVMRRLEEGADIGCSGRGRLPTKTKNTESAFLY